MTYAERQSLLNRVRDIAGEHAHAFVFGCVVDNEEGGRTYLSIDSSHHDFSHAFGVANRIVSDLKWKDARTNQELEDQHRAEQREPDTDDGEEEWNA